MPTAPVTRPAKLLSELRTICKKASPTPAEIKRAREAFCELDQLLTSGVRLPPAWRACEAACVGVGTAIENPKGEVEIAVTEETAPPQRSKRKRDMSDEDFAALATEMGFEVK